MNTVKIRPAKAPDAASLAKMLAQLADELGDGDVFSSDSNIIHRYGFSDKPLFHCMMAQKAQKHVGFALYFDHFSTTRGQAGVYVQDLWVDPLVRNAEVGPKLLCAVTQHAKQAWNASYMQLTVHSFNRRAERFYNRLGFSVSNNELLMTLDGTDFINLETAK